MVGEQAAWAGEASARPAPTSKSAIRVDTASAVSATPEQVAAAVLAQQAQLAHVETQMQVLRGHLDHVQAQHEHMQRRLSLGTPAPEQAPGEGWQPPLALASPPAWAGSGLPWSPTPQRPASPLVGACSSAAGAATGAGFVVGSDAGSCAGSGVGVGVGVPVSPPLAPSGAVAGASSQPLPGVAVGTASPPPPAACGGTFRFRCVKMLAEGSNGVVYLSLRRRDEPAQEGPLPSYCFEGAGAGAGAAAAEPHAPAQAQRALPTLRLAEADLHAPLETVAIKAIDPARVGAELAITRRVCAGDASPFVVQLVFVAATSRCVFVGMEFCSGGDLYKLMSSEELRPADVLFYACEIGEALRHVHARDVLHCDIKPENVGLGADGHLRLYDFGQSRVLCEEDRNPRTGRREVVTHSGTLPYCCPEVLRRAPHSYESDWWSFAVLVYEMFFGCLPWHTEDDIDTCELICTAELELPHEGPPADDLCWDLVQQMLRKNRDARLGYPGGWSDIKQHAWFAKVDWDKCRARKYAAPFLVV
jgi:serine/threonine protein kinase